MPVNRFFSVFFLSLHLAAMGQSGQPEEGVSLAERKFLDLILRDTISSTICRLPKGMNFGIQNPDTGRLVLVKEGKINQLLLEGTNHVYEPDPTRKNGLLRVDSTFYTGDNFNFIAFRRRDTLFQYGGYGFWDTRDFFTWYRAWNHEWEIQVQTDYLQQQWTAYQYDPETDALFTMGRRYRGPFDSADQYVDSVYRFDFSQNKWKNLGRIVPTLPWRNHPLYPSELIAHTPFGLLLTAGDKFLLADIAHDHLLSSNEYFSKKLREWNLSDTPDLKYKRIFIYLKDSLYLIEDRSGETIFLHTKMSLQDFKPLDPNPHIYAACQLKKTWLILIVAILALGSMLVIILKRTSKGKLLSERPESKLAEISAQLDSAPENTTTGTECNQPAVLTQVDSYHQGKDVLTNFLTHLSEVERALVIAIVKSTIEDQKMDIQQINEIIGVGQKPMSMQKARRSLVVHQINRKFSLITRSDILLIHKERDVFEKRSYVYSADTASAHALNSLMM